MAGVYTLRISILGPFLFSLRFFLHQGTVLQIWNAFASPIFKFREILTRVPEISNLGTGGKTVRSKGWTIIALTIIGAYLYVNHQFIEPSLLAARQEKSCKKQANRVFTAKPSPLDGSVGHYMYHFDVSLDRCLMVVAYTVHDAKDNETRKSYKVIDTFKQATIYAEYFETALPGFRTAVIECYVKVPDEKAVLCHSAEEWNRLVGPYIGTETLTR